MEKLNYSILQVEQINQIHIHAVDKLYRMYTGVSSRIAEVKHGVVSLEVIINMNWEKSVHETARQFISDWRDSPVLKGFQGWPERITGWDVTVYAELNYSS
jgi:hypothetical protein